MARRMLSSNQCRQVTGTSEALLATVLFLTQF